MGELALGAASALWLGLLTSASPCPLATNVAAVSFIGRRVDSPRLVVGGGLLYSLGRMVAYAALGSLIIAGLLAVPSASQFLQRHMNRFLGPILIAVGLVLVGLVRFSLPGLGRSGERARERLAVAGMWSAAPLGLLFALSFCPISAALFFGSLVPLAVRLESPVLLPTVYGAGTALPVLAVAIPLALGARFVGRALDRLSQIELWARRVTGIVFVGVGTYMTLAYTLKLI